MHARVQGKCKSEAGIIQTAWIARNLGSPALSGCVNFAGVVRVSVFVEAGRTHHASIAEFGQSWIPASVWCVSVIWFLCNRKTPRRSIENRGVHKYREGYVGGAAHASQGSRGG